MKLRIRSLFTILFLTGAVLCATAGLTSCENFLRGADIKRQLEDSIAYANANSCKVYLKSNTAMGSFLSDGEKDFKVGFATDIQFTLNKDDYYFVSLEAVSVNDEKISRANCVEFTLDQKASDLEKGIYVTKVKLLKEANDIQIRPKCIELPCIKSYSPSGILPNPANTPIVINFNIPVEEPDQSESLFNYKNIKLIDADTINDPEPVSLSDCFITPEFNAQKTILTLFPKGDQIAKYINRNDKAYVDINVCFPESLTVVIDKYNFPIRQDNNSSFIVRYDTDMEVVPPEELDLFVTKEEINLEKALSLGNDKKILLIAYNNDNKDTINDNLKDRIVSSTIYIYGRYYDKGSGVAAIDVTESTPDMAKVLSGSTSGGTNFISYFLKEKNDNVTYFDDGSGIVSFVIKHTIQESLREKPRAGLFDIKIQVKDSCGNYAEAQDCCVNYLEFGDLSYYTSCVKGSRPPHYTLEEGGPANIDQKRIIATPFDVCNAPFSMSPEDNTCYDFTKYNSDIKKIRIKDEFIPSVFFLESGISNSNFTEKYYISCNDVVYYCEYVDRHDITQTLPFTSYNSETLERSVVLDVESVTGMSFYVIAKYNGIQIGKKKFTFPPMVMLNGISDMWINIDGDIDYDIPISNKPKRTCQPIGIYKNSDNNYHLIFGIEDGLQKTIIPDDVSCYFTYVFMDGATDLEFATSKYKINNGEYMSYDYTTYDFDHFLDPDDENRWIEKGLLGELRGPYVKTQQNVDIPDRINTTIEKSKDKEGFVNITLKWDSDLWEKYDSLKIILDNQNLMITQSDTFIKDGKICYTIPLATTGFFKMTSFGNSVADRVLTYHCRGIKNGFITAQTEIEEQSIRLVTDDTIDEKTAFDDIKPSDLYYYCMSSDTNDDNHFIEFSFYDLGSGPDYGEFYINDRPQKYEITESYRDKNGYYGNKVDLSKFNAGTNKIDYILRDKKGNTNEGTLTFDLMNILSLGDKFKNVSVSDKKLSVDISSYKSSINKNEGEIKIYGSSSTTWICLATIDSTNSTSLISGSTINNIDLKNYTFIKLVYCGVDSKKPCWDTRIFCQAANNFNPSDGANCVLPDGGANDSIIILSSDNKVYTQLYRTTNPDCQNWSERQWKLFATRNITGGVVNVTADKPTVYKFATPSNSYYRIIVHFANGKISSGQVMHK